MRSAAGSGLQLYERLVRQIDCPGLWFKGTQGKVRLTSFLNFNEKEIYIGIKYCSNYIKYKITYSIESRVIFLIFTMFSVILSIY